MNNTIIPSGFFLIKGNVIDTTNATKVVINSCNFSNNYAVNTHHPSDDHNANVSWLIGGVGVFAYSKVYICDSIFSNNAADSVGALCLLQSDVNISASKFIHNSAMGYSDGAIYIDSGTVVIQSTVFRYLSLIHI